MCARRRARTVGGKPARGDPMDLYLSTRVKRGGALERQRGHRATGKRTEGPWMILRRALIAMVTTAVVAGIPAMASAKQPVARELTAFAAPGCAGGCRSGSTVGPDKALYVTDGPGGRVLRVDPGTGAVTTFASGLPRAVPEAGIGGAMDVVFLGDTAYVLVTLVGPAFGQ